MEFTRSNWKDIQRYFDNTWIKLAEFGDTLFFVATVRSSEITGYTANGDDFILELHDDQPYVVEYVLPHRAVFQHGNRAAFLQRVPAKQYRRGLCSDNTRCIYPDTGGPIDINAKTLLSYTNKTSYRSFGEAFNTKGSKLITVALSPRMWATKSSGSINIDTRHIASYDRKDNKILVHAKQFVPEIKRHIEAFNENIGVIV